MKQIKFINILLSMLLAVMFVGCQSDNDDLEYDNPENIIVGTWKITKFIPGGGHFNFKPGTVLVFHNNGTFTDSSNGRKHTWKIASYKGGKSYTGGIYFDGIYYDIISLSDPKYTGERKESTWMVGLPDPSDNNNDSGDGGYIEEWGLDPTDNFDDNGSDESDSGPSSPTDDPDDSDPSLPSDDPDESEPSGGNGKLVSKIAIWSPAGLLQTIKFYYDNTNRVTSIECSGQQEIIPNLKNGIRLYYYITDNTMVLYHSTGNTTRTRGDGTGSGYGNGRLNGMGYLVYDCLNNTQQDLYYDHFSYGEYIYSDKGETMHLNSADYVWENGNIKWGCFDNSGRERYYHTTTENKANINLNRLFTHTYKHEYNNYEDVYALALCGYIGNKDKHLLSQIEGGSNTGKFSYEFDTDGYPTVIIYDRASYDYTRGYRCIIEYTTGGNYNFPVY